MELVSVKILVLALSGLVRLIFGMMPLVVVKTIVKKWSKATDKRMKKVISILMFFGGGVLLATCFLHMMPEVRDNFAKAEPKLEFPFSEIVFLAGFFMVYLIEDIVHSIVHKRRIHKEAKNLTQRQAHANSNGDVNLSSRTVVIEDKGLHNNDGAIINARTVNTNNIAAALKPNNGVSHTTHGLSLSLSTHENEHRINPNNLRETKQIFCKNTPNEEIPGLPKSRCQNGIGGITNGAFVSEKFQYCDPDWWKDIVHTNSENGFGRRGRNCDELSCANISEPKSTLTSPPNSQRYSKSETNNNAHLQIPSSPKLSRNNNGHSHMHLPMDQNDLDESIGGEIRNILIVIAISFHGVFEGMAIGLQSSVSDVWYLFLAVSLHECTILFCIGVELISSKTKVFRMVLYILVVSLVSPVGIAIGIVVTEKSYGGAIHQALVIGCLQGLAAGTLLYVTFFEIFQEEGKKLHRKCYHILVAVLGFILMGSLEFMGGHNHGEEHSHNHGTPQNSTIAEDTHEHDDHNHNHGELGKSGHDHDHSH